MTWINHLKSAYKYLIEHHGATKVFITTCPLAQIKYKYNRNTCPNDIFTCPEKKIFFFFFKSYVHYTLLACPPWSFKMLAQIWLLLALRNRASAKCSTLLNMFVKMHFLKEFGNLDPHLHMLHWYIYLWVRTKTLSTCCMHILTFMCTHKDSFSFSPQILLKASIHLISCIVSQANFTLCEFWFVLFVFTQFILYTG